ncbi:MAG: hypothetical protein Q9M48_06100 [Rhodobacterales bacterium]|nr:hypothetical protein [Rhodobacterales bacterium]
MQQFALAYYGGSRPATKEEGQAHMSNWMGWINDLGDAVINSGMYFGASRHVNANGTHDGPAGAPLNGLTILQFATMDEACTAAATCPHIGIGGTIDVAPLMQM